jgi:predicted nucleotidyltransferase component of viral defense system
MNLHLDKERFAELLRIIGNSTRIDTDVLEKDYYVCVVLEQLAKNQDDLNAYFKGGTSLYKKLDEMRRFSEDVDLTVRTNENLSNTQNKKVFEKAAKGYSVEGLMLLPDKTDNRKGSITAFYEYQSVVEYIVNPLRRSGEIQVEATSFTESEPLEDCEIMPLVYKYANDLQRQIMGDNYGVRPFNLKTISLERTFIDKLFASQKYLHDMDTPDLSKPNELAKHLYDIAVLSDESRIERFLNDKEEVKRIECIRRREELNRVGGVSADLAMSDFLIFKEELSKSVIDAFLDMQAKYVLADKYRITPTELRNALNKIHEALRSK